MYEPAYVQIEGTWHEVAEDEHTACGIEIPYPGTLLTRETPDKVHCGAQATTEKPAEKKASKTAKAKKK